MAKRVCLAGGNVLGPDGTIETRDVWFVGDRIIDANADAAETIDCRGRYVLPGIVDVHGDAFEHALYPRPGVDIAPAIALTSVDQQLIANGITTAFHGLTLSWEPGARSLATGRSFMAGLAENQTRFVARHRVQLRWETFAHDAVDDIARWLDWSPLPAVAFNDHTTATMEKVASGQHKKLDQWAQRAGLTKEAYLAAVNAVGSRAPDVPEKIREVAGMAKRHGVVTLSHDERTVAERAANRALGIGVCEFPLAAEVAADAVAHGEHVVLGGPNVIRGGSHTGAMSAEDAIRDKLCTVLASDYYYPSLLHAVRHLVERGVFDFGAAWALVSQNPAEAMGLSDCGVIEIGRRADLIVLDATGSWRIAHTVSGGAITSFGRR